MPKSRVLFIMLAIMVVGWYVASTFLPQAAGSCLNGPCDPAPLTVGISLLLPVLMAAIPVTLEAVLGRKSVLQALDDRGLTRFSPCAFVIIVIYLLPLFVFFPGFALATGQPLSLQPEAAWRAAAVLLNNGLNEETMMRGFVFRHRRQGRSFWRAAAISTLYFAAYHIPLIVFAGPQIGIIGVAISVPTGLLTAYVYEQGENTILSSALVHAGTNMPAFVFAFASSIQPIVISLFLLAGIIIASVVVGKAYWTSRTAGEAAPVAPVNETLVGN